MSTKRVLGTQPPSAQPRALHERRPAGRARAWRARGAPRRAVATRPESSYLMWVDVREALPRGQFRAGAPRCFGGLRQAFAGQAAKLRRDQLSFSSAKLRLRGGKGCQPTYLPLINFRCRQFCTSMRCRWFVGTWMMREL